MFFPDEKQYLKLCRDYKYIPVSTEYPSDTETPITVFSKLACQQPSFLLESVEGGDKLGRYSFIGFDSLVTFTVTGSVNSIEKDGHKEVVLTDPFTAIKNILEDYKTPDLPGMPRFCGGAVGYLGYDLVRHLEKLPDSAKKEAGIPDCIMMIPKINIVLDHIKHTLIIIVNTNPGEKPLAEYYKAQSLHKEILAKISAARPPEILKTPDNIKANKLYSNLSREEFINKVEQAKKHIKSGEILQVVLSRRIEQEFDGDPFKVYRRLRRNNPSPYLYFINYKDVVLVGSSPEMLIRVEDKNIEVRPIAGTRRRGSCNEEDELLAADLLSDEKEQAEHLMLVDLGRNDVGKVCKPGQVKVPTFMEVEKYSHVMHLVSSVTGVLPEDIDSFEAFKACFPAGTVSGAPKVRAMEIIEELEPSRRGPYAGAVGYIGFNGNIDTAITIRTIVFYNGKASIQVGAGIVADSDPEQEYIETENKAGALIKALAEEDNRFDSDYR